MNHKSNSIVFSQILGVDQELVDKTGFNVNQKFLKWIIIQPMSLYTHSILNFGNPSVIFSDKSPDIFQRVERCG